MKGKDKFQETWYQWVTILIVTLVLAVVLFVVIEPAAGFSRKSQYYKISLHSIKEANYNPDPHQQYFAQLDLGIIAEVIRDHEGPSINIPERMMAVTSVLLSPVPTTTPYPLEDSIIGNDNVSKNQNPGTSVDSSWPNSSTEPMSTSTQFPTSTAAIVPPRPTPSTTPTGLQPTLTILPPPITETPTATASSTPTQTKAPYILPSPSPTQKPPNLRTQTPSVTATASYTPTNTMTPTASPTSTATFTPTSTSTYTHTPTHTSTSTATPTHTRTTTATSTATDSTCPVNPISLTAVQDSWIDETKKDQNYGTDVVLIVHPTAGFDRRALVQFDLSSIPSDCSITSATLVINQILSSDQVVINIFRVTQAWNEMSVTWNSAPGYYAAIVTSYNGNVLTPLQRSIDITDLTTGWYSNSYNNYGILMGASTGNGRIELESRESSNPPVLRIEFDHD
jgi:hypothetical protein